MTLGKIRDNDMRHCYFYKSTCDIGDPPSRAPALSVVSFDAILLHNGEDNARQGNDGVPNSIMGLNAYYYLRGGSWTVDTVCSNRRWPLLANLDICILWQEFSQRIIQIIS